MVLGISPLPVLFMCRSCDFLSDVPREGLQM